MMTLILILAGVGDESDRALYRHLPAEDECERNYHAAEAMLAKADTPMRVEHAEHLKAVWWGAWWVRWSREGFWCDGLRQCPETRALWAGKVKQLVGARAWQVGALPQVPR